MTLAEKGARTIVVDGTAYRWKASPNYEPGIGIVVEHAQSPAQRLVSWTDLGAVVTPRLVRDAIREGLRAGWHPTSPGAEFVQRLGASPTEVGALKQCPCCDYFTLPRRGEYLICTVCLWEDSGQDLDRLDEVSGPNHMSLRTARANFARLGACKEAALPRVLDEARRERFRRHPR